MTNEKKLEMWQTIGVHGWVFVLILMAIIMAGGCGDAVLTDPNENNNNSYNPTSTHITVASEGHIAVMTSEWSASNHFLPSEFKVFHTFNLARPAIMFVSGEDRLAIDADEPMQIWTVPQSMIEEFIVLIETYYANNAAWSPDLFPDDWSESRDIQWIMSVFACSPEVSRPDLAPSGCAPEGVTPSGLFQLVSSDGHDDWIYNGSNGHDDFGGVQFRLVFAR